MRDPAVIQRGDLWVSADNRSREHNCGQGWLVALHEARREKSAEDSTLQAMTTLAAIAVAEEGDHRIEQWSKFWSLRRCGLPAWYGGILFLCGARLMDNNG
jgi:hypothetical protein